MLYEINTATHSYKFGSTDLKFTLCFDKEYDANGVEKGTCFIAESLRDEDCFSKCKDAFVVTHIFSKANDKTIYDSLLYSDSKYSINDLPNEIKNKIDNSLLNMDTEKNIITSVPTKPSVSQPISQKQSLKLMITKAAQQKQVITLQQSNNIHKNKNPNIR